MLNILFVLSEVLSAWQFQITWPGANLLKSEHLNLGGYSLIRGPGKQTERIPLNFWFWVRLIHLSILRVKIALLGSGESHEQLLF